MAKQQSRTPAQLVDAFLETIKVIPWDTWTAETSGVMWQCGLWERSQLIAAHAYSTGMMIVTSDEAFLTATGLSIDDWGLVNYQTAGYILDLQQVTAKLMRHDAPT